MTEKKNNNTDNDLNLKYEFLEKRYNDTIVFFKITLSSITGVIVIISIIIALFSYSSKREITEAIRDMERKFEVLSEQALKFPKIDILRRKSR